MLEQLSARRALVATAIKFAQSQCEAAFLQVGVSLPGSPSLDGVPPPRRRLTCTCVVLAPAASTGALREICLVDLPTRRRGQLGMIIQAFDELAVQQGEPEPERERDDTGDERETATHPLRGHGLGLAPSTAGLSVVCRVVRGAPPHGDEDQVLLLLGNAANAAAAAAGAAAEGLSLPCGVRAWVSHIVCVGSGRSAATVRRHVEAAARRGLGSNGDLQKRKEKQFPNRKRKSNRNAVRDFYNRTHSVCAPRFLILDTWGSRGRGQETATQIPKQLPGA